MIGNKYVTIFMISGMLLAASAWAAEKPDAGPVAAGSGQSSGQDETAIPATTPLSGPVDAAASHQPAVPATEAGAMTDTPKTETPPQAETEPETGAAPGSEDVSGAESPTNADAAAGEETATEEPGPEELVEETVIADPIEPWNRAMYHFNDKLYFWVLKPVARGYNVVVPEPVRISARNFFNNVAMPIRFVNCLLQLKLKGAGIELARFGLNSVIGLGGFFDVAKSRFELDARKEDFGQTLGFYGMGGLMYIVWPLLGPSTIRDTIGFAGDSFLDPVKYLNPFEAAFGVQVYERVNNTSLEIGTYEDMKQSAIEPYIAIRDAFIQYRKEQIRK